MGADWAWRAWCAALRRETLRRGALPWSPPKIARPAAARTVIAVALAHLCFVSPTAGGT